MVRHLRLVLPIKDVYNSFNFGIKHLAKSYKAGIDNGWADKNAGLEHYRVEIEKTSLDQAKKSVIYFTTRK